MRHVPKRVVVVGGGFGEVLFVQRFPLSPKYSVSFSVFLGGFLAPNSSTRLVFSQFLSGVGLRVKYF